MRRRNSSAARSASEEPPPSPGPSEAASWGEANSDADLAERHAAALAHARSRPLGLLERQDSANYQPRPPTMTERQDSARNLQAMEEEMAELAAASPDAEAAGDLERRDSAADLARQPLAARSMSARRSSITGGTELQERMQQAPDQAQPQQQPAAAQEAPRAAAEHGRAGNCGAQPAGVDDASARVSNAVTRRRDSASEQPTEAERGVPSSLGSTDAAAAAGGGGGGLSSAPSLRAARALMRASESAQSIEAGSGDSLPHVCGRGLAAAMRPALSLPPEDDLDSALDSLVAARHAVLADLAADRAELAATSAVAAAENSLASVPSHDDSALGRSGSSAWQSPPRNRGRPASASDASLFRQRVGACDGSSEAPRLDPLLQARALVQPQMAWQASVPESFEGMLEHAAASERLGAVRRVVLGTGVVSVPSAGAARPQSAHAACVGPADAPKQAAQLSPQGGRFLRSADGSPGSGGARLLRMLSKQRSSAGQREEGALAQNGAPSGSGGRAAQALEADAAQASSLSLDEGRVTFFGQQPLESPSSSLLAARQAVLRGDLSLQHTNAAPSSSSASGFAAPAASSPFDQGFPNAASSSAGSGGGQDSPMHTLQQARHVAAVRTGSAAGVLPSVASLGVASRRGSRALPDSPMTTAGESAAPQWPLVGASPIDWQRAVAEASQAPAARHSGYDSANERPESSG